jgi:hypothetical protein
MAWLAEKLRDYGVNEETITNVLKDIKSEEKEVLVPNGGTEGKNTPEENLRIWGQSRLKSRLNFKAP